MKHRAAFRSCRNSMIAGIAVAAYFAALCPCRAAAQTLAATPPMGWNSWNHFHRTIDDDECARRPTRWFRPACEMPGTST